MGARRLTGLALVGGFLTTLSNVGPAYAANPNLHYPTYSAVVNNETTATFPAAGSPTALVASTRPLVAATSATLSGTTPFGQVFGSSSGKAYLRVDVKASTPSVTTITFSSPIAANTFAFALGDIDAESVTVTMTSDGTTAVSSAAMGAQEPFNYSGADDLPTVTSGTNILTVADTRCVSAAQQCDTNGATAWFQPTSAVKTITLTGTKISGLPEYQLWMASGAFQDVDWVPTTKITPGSYPTTFTPSALATVTPTGGSITYKVTDSGTTECEVHPTTAVITATSDGTCEVTATAAAAGALLAGSATVTFIIGSPDPQAVSWSPTTTLSSATFPATFTPDDLPAGSDNGAISYSVADPGTAGCTVDASTGAITSTSPGTCRVSATAAATDDYGAGSITLTFTFSLPLPDPEAREDNEKEVASGAVAQAPELAATGSNHLSRWPLVAIVAGAVLMAGSQLNRRREAL